VKKLKDSNSDKTQMVTNSKTQIVTKLNSNWNKTQELKLRQNLTTQIVTKLKNQTARNLKNSSC
jgi:hypothetical protein